MTFGHVLCHSSCNPFICLIKYLLISESVLESLEECEVTKVISTEYIFHSTHDAVTKLRNAEFSPAVAGNSTKL